MDCSPLGCEDGFELGPSMDRNFGSEISAKLDSDMCWTFKCGLGKLGSARGTDLWVEMAPGVSYNNIVELG